MDRVCYEEIWIDILSHNFSDFLNRLRDELKDNLEIYFYLSYRFHSFIFDNLSLYSVFAHFTLCKRRCDKKEPYKRFCNFCSRITPQIFDKEYNFNDIIIDERDFTREFNDFFFFKFYFLLIFVVVIHFLSTQRKLKYLVVHILKTLKPQTNFLESL